MEKAVCDQQLRVCTVKGGCRTHSQPRRQHFPALCFTTLTLFHLVFMSGFIFVGREVEGESKKSCVTLISPPADVSVTV